MAKLLKEDINVSYSDLKNNKHNLPIVYQCAFRDRVASIFRSGYSREYAGSAGGNFYCTGVYSTFNLQSTIENVKTKSDLYGNTIIKMGIKSYERFFILNRYLAKKVYGDNFTPEKQLEILFANHQDKLNQIKQSRAYQSIININTTYTSVNVQALLDELGGMCCRCDPYLDLYDIRGFIFHGRNDGYVAIIRDFKAIVPLAYSIDEAKTWKNDLFTKETYDKTANDYDPIIFLGYDAKDYINPKTYRMINEYMRVQRKNDRKYNLLDTKKKFISPVWFDKLSPMGDSGKALAELDNEVFYIDKYGLYENENDRYPFMDYNDLMNS